MKTIAVEFLDLTPGDRILDIGCGEGRHLYSCYRDTETNVVGMDTDRSSLRTFRDWFTEMPFPHRTPKRSWGILQGSAFRLPFRHHSFDVVICAEVLEHLRDYRSALNEMHRVLKPGGRLAISVPRFFAEWVCWVLSDEEDFPSNSGGHVRIFRREELRRRIERRGFKLEIDYSVHGLHTPYWWLKALLGNLDRPPTVVDEDETPDWWPRSLTGRGEYAHPLLEVCHRFLVWHIMRRPLLTRWLESVLNPWLGKSLVMHFRKSSVSGTPSVPTDPSVERYG